MTVFWFLIKEGFKGLGRSKYAGVFSIFIIWISLTLVGLGYVIARDMLYAVNNIRAQFDVDIFIHKTASQKQISDFAEYLNNMPEIESLKYISPEQAAQNFKKEFGENIFNILGYNPLPPSFTIRLKEMYRNLVSVESIATNIRKQEIVDEVKYRKKFLMLLEKYQRITLFVVLIIFVSLSIVSILLISNSIKMAIFARREIIDSMKLLGATDRFVKAPFIIEGIIEGFIGASLAALVIYGLFYLQNNYLQSLIEYKAIVSYRYYIALIIVGVFMGLVGSARAIKRFLR